MNELIDNFCTKYNLSRNDGLMLLKHMEPVEFSKHTQIVQEGKHNSTLYLISKGILRAYSMVDGMDITQWFASEGEFLFSVWSYVDNSASRTTIETLTDCSAYYISRAKLNELFNSSIEMSNLGRKLIEQHCLLIENWWQDWEKPTAKERYLAVLEKSPELLLQVPLRQIASYLRITPQSLSRIRAEL